MYMYFLFIFLSNVNKETLPLLTKVLAQEKARHLRDLIVWML